MNQIRAEGYSPTIRKRSLSRRLVELRKACGLTTTEVQRQLNWSEARGAHPARPRGQAAGLVAQVQRRVPRRAARVQRQKILTRDHDPCALHAVIDENAILRITDPQIRQDQIARILDLASRPTIDVQLLPIAAGIYPGAGEVFSYLSFPDPAERDFVYLESAIDDRMLEETDELERYKLRFAQLAAAALTPEHTRGHLTHQNA
jgi:Domain of unknown function (DUF5753)